MTVGGTAVMASSFMRNRIINGGMQFDQRNSGGSKTYTAAAAISYCVDRFYGSCTGANVTGQRVVGPTGFQYCYQFTGAASVTGILFGQRIESYNCADFVSQNVTLSANISNSLLTTVTWTAYYANTTDTFSAKTQIATGTFTVSSTATTYQATFNAGANAANGIAIEFTVGAQTSGTWKITGVQLEAGIVATPFERKLFGYEQLLCQRYYYQWQAASGFNTPFINVFAIGTTTGFGVITMPALMRTSPTMTTSGTAADYRIFIGGTSYNCNSVPFVDTPDIRSVAIQFPTAGSFTTGNAGFMQATATTGVAYLGFSSEL